MKRINVYEAEPGDYRWTDADECWHFYASEVTDEQYIELCELERSRRYYNKLLADIKDREIEMEL